MHDVVEAIADALEPLTLEIAGLQIDPYINGIPTPPTIDIYPAPDVFLERTAMGAASWEAVFVVRARVSTVDWQAGQQLLLRLMDPRNTDTSVVGLLLADGTLGGTVQASTVELPTGYGEYADPASDGRLLGCVWRDRVIL